MIRTLGQLVKSQLLFLGTHVDQTSYLAELQALGRYAGVQSRENPVPLFNLSLQLKNTDKIGEVINRHSIDILSIL